MKGFIAMLSLLLLALTTRSQDKIDFALTGGLSYSSYSVVRSSYSKNPGAGFPGDSKDLPSLNGGVGYGIGVDIDYSISRKIRVLVGAGYESERFTVETGTLRQPLPGNNTGFYSSEKNRLQQLIDLNWGIGYEIAFRNDQKLLPSISAGTTIGITKNSDPYSYVMPALKWYADKNWYIGAGVKIGDQRSDFKTSEYTGENIMVTEFQYRVTSFQLLIGCSLKKHH